jgi:hypothetical protein
MQEKRMRGESAKQVAIDVLRAARKPLHTKEITKRVIESGRSSGLKGKTPEATVARLEPPQAYEQIVEHEAGDETDSSAVATDQSARTSVAMGSAGVGSHEDGDKE